MDRSTCWKITSPLRSLWLLATRLAPERLKLVIRYAPRASHVLRSQGPRVLWEKASLRLRRAPRFSAAPTRLLDVPENYVPFGISTSSKPEVSIVIRCFNRLPHAYNCLLALSMQDSSRLFEVILVNDAPSAETRGLLSRVTGIRVIENETNLGFIRSCNRGAASARGEYLVFLNSDTQVQARWLDALIETFSIRPDAGIVGSRLVYPDGRLRAAGGIVGEDGNAWRYGEGDDPGRPQYSYLRAVDYCSGSSLAIRRDLFEQLSGFDEYYIPAYYEDADIAFRCRELGYQVYYQPLSVAVHLGDINVGIDEASTSNVRRDQTVNREKLLERWRPVLASHHPDEFERSMGAERSVRRRILVADVYMITPDRESGSLRMLNLIRLLQELGLKVTFAPLNLEARAPYTHDLQKCGVECLYRPYVISIAEHLKQSGALYDVVILSRADAADELMPAVKAYCPNAKVVFDTVDLHFLRELREANLRGDKRLMKVAERRKHQEISLMREAHTTLVVSPFEQELLAHELPGADIQVVSNIHEIYGSLTPFRDRRDILFIGGFAHPANVDAVLFFVQEILPTVHEHEPDLVLYIVGNSPPVQIRALDSERIRVTGYVPDVEPFFRKCRASVAPLRYGAGVKGKVNLSMAYGVPVVGTSVAVEGMHLKHGTSALVADQPEEFARCLLKVYSDERIWSHLSSNAIEVMRNHFSFEAAKQALERVLGPGSTGASRPEKTHDRLVVS